MERRAFLASILALATAPSIVRASSLMPIRVLGVAPVFPRGAGGVTYYVDFESGSDWLDGSSWQRAKATLASAAAAVRAGDTILVAPYHIESVIAGPYHWPIAAKPLA